MPAVATSPSVPMFLVSARFRSEFCPEPQGEAGRVLIRNARKALRQWVERAEMLNASIGLVVGGDGGGAIRYESVPPNRRFHVKTRYVFLGKGKPMPFELDDE